MPKAVSTLILPPTMRASILSTCDLMLAGTTEAYTSFLARPTRFSLKPRDSALP